MYGENYLQFQGGIKRLPKSIEGFVITKLKAASNAAFNFVLVPYQYNLISVVNRIP